MCLRLVEVARVTPPQMSDPNSYTHELNLTKSLLIVTALQKKEDLRAIRHIRRHQGRLVWEPLARLMIDKQVWDYAIERQGYDPRLVFCHPDILLSRPRPASTIARCAVFP